MGEICINVMEDSAEFQLNDSVEGIAQEGMAVILHKKHYFYFRPVRLSWREAKEGLEAESERDKEALNRCGTESVTITVTPGKDASKNDTGDLLDTDFDDFAVLTENDVPGSALNGKQPHELNILQLKRWLACHGAPMTGNKPELIERYDTFQQ